MSYQLIELLQEVEHAFPLPESSPFDFYPFCNEDMSSIIPFFRENKAPPNTGIRVGLLFGESNFPSLAEMDVDLILLADINLNMHQHTKRLFFCMNHADNPHEFIKKFNEVNPEKNHDVKAKNKFLNALYFLDNEERFTSCKLALKKKSVAHIHLNLLDLKQCYLLISILEKYKAKISCANFTNIHHYDTIGMSHIGAALLLHKSPGAIVIHSHFGINRLISTPCIGLSRYFQNDSHLFKRMKTQFRTSNTKYKTLDMFNGFLRQKASKLGLDENECIPLMHEINHEKMSLTFNGRCLHLEQAVPDNSARYKNHYFFIKNALYYIDHEAVPITISLMNPQEFLKTLHNIKIRNNWGKDTMLYLSKNEVIELMAWNSNHVPYPNDRMENKKIIQLLQCTYSIFQINDLPKRAMQGKQVFIKKEDALTRIKQARENTREFHHYIAATKITCFWKMTKERSLWNMRLLDNKVPVKQHSNQTGTGNLSNL